MDPDAMASTDFRALTGAASLKVLEDDEDGVVQAFPRPNRRGLIEGDLRQ